MEQTTIQLWQLSKDECQKLIELTPVLIFNKLSNTYTVELTTSNAIFFKENCSQFNIFYTMTQPKFKEEK